MIDHVSIRVSNLKKSTAFYEPALKEIGYKRLEGDFDGATGFAHEGPEDASGSFWLIEAEDGEPLSRNVHVAFGAKDTGAVQRFYNAAINAGGRDNGAPAKCPEYGSRYYGGFVLDPDGNNIEATTYVD